MCAGSDSSDNMNSTLLLTGELGSDQQQEQAAIEQASSGLVPSTPEQADEGPIATRTCSKHGRSHMDSEPEVICACAAPVC